MSEKAVWPDFKKMVSERKDFLNEALEVLRRLSSALEEATGGKVRGHLEEARTRTPGGVQYRWSLIPIATYESEYKTKHWLFTLHKAHQSALTLLLQGGGTLSLMVITDNYLAKNEVELKSLEQLEELLAKITQSRAVQELVVELMNLS